MQTLEEIATLQFEGTEGPLDSKDFIDFLEVLRAAYFYSVQLGIENSTVQDVVDNESGFTLRFNHLVTNVSWPRNPRFMINRRERPRRKASFFGGKSSQDVRVNAINHAAHRRLEHLELKFTEIQKQSPLAIICLSCVPALALAVILSGGEVDLIRMKFKLKPLGTGIQNLRKALLPPKPQPPPKTKNPNKGNVEKEITAEEDKSP